MTDPMSIAIATAIVGKAVEIAGEQARETVAALARKVRDKFRGRPAEEAILAAAAAEPESIERVTELAGALRRTALEDPTFDTALRDLWNQVRVDVTAEQMASSTPSKGRRTESCSCATSTET